MKTPKEYLALIGAKGGKKSRRTLTKEEASRIAMVRWAKKVVQNAIIQSAEIVTKPSKPLETKQIRKIPI